MNKKEAITLFSGEGSTRPQGELADAARITSQAISKWPDRLGIPQLGRLVLATFGRGKTDREYKDEMIAFIREKQRGHKS